MNNYLSGKNIPFSQRNLNYYDPHLDELLNYLNAYLSLQRNDFIQEIISLT